MLLAPLVLALAVAGAAAAQPAPSNGVAALTAPAVPATAGGTVVVRGVVVGNRRGYRIPEGYARAELSVYAGLTAELSVPVKWDKPLPRRLDPGAELRFTAVLPADRLLLRCPPRPAASACAFDVEGPFPAGRLRDWRVDLDLASVEVSVEPDAAERARWAAPRVADKGLLPKHPGAVGYEPGALLVGFPDGVTLDAAEALVAALGWRIRSTHASGSSVRMTLLLPPDVAIEDGIAALNGRARYAEPNWSLRIDVRLEPGR